MRLHNKLARWRQAGLLTAEQSAAILEHERQRASFGWHSGLAFVGVFAIVIGILAIVAANWLLIPGWLKLGVHLLLNVVVALGALHSWPRRLVNELCLLAWYGLTLTFIGLMGQVFHLGGNLPDALLLWTVLTGPAVILLAMTRLVLLPWLLGCLLTLMVAYVEYVSPLLDASGALPWLLFSAILPATLALGAVYLRAERWQVLRHLLAGFASILPILFAAIASQFWYSTSMRTTRDAFAEIPTSNLLLVIAVALLAVFLSCYRRQAVAQWLENATNLRLLLISTTAINALPFLLPWVESQILAALSFIGLWLLLAWIGQRTQNGRLVSLAIIIITLRIYIIYLEVFGSLLQTGFGLIFSGALLLLLLRFARVLSRKVSIGAPRGTHPGDQP